MSPKNNRSIDLDAPSQARPTVQINGQSYELVTQYDVTVRQANEIKLALDGLSLGGEMDSEALCTAMECIFAEPPDVDWQDVPIGKINRLIDFFGQNYGA